MAALHPERSSEVFISQGEPTQESIAPTKRSQGDALINQPMVSRGQAKKKQPMVPPK
ncbi:uncharacterized protein J3R85_018539 [Psidium guajava]|nr:uncharacterized protein J3R85_018539 [Psidium guajava]